MLKERARAIHLGVFAVDLLLVTGAFFLAHWARDLVIPWLAPEAFPQRFYPLSTYLPLLPWALAIWAVLLATSGRYRSQRTVSILAEAWAIVRLCGSGLVVFLMTVFALRLDEAVLGDSVSRLWIALFATFACLLLLAEKLTLRLTARYFRSRGYNYRSIVIVGTTAAARSIARAIEEHPYWGFRILGFVSTGRHQTTKKLDRYPVLGALEDIVEITDVHIVDDVVFTVGRRDLGRFEDMVLKMQELGIRTMFALNLFPHARPQLDLSEIDGIPLLTLSTAPTRILPLFFKRCVDIALSMTLLLLFLPVSFTIALAIRVSSRGSVLFQQTRCGLNGRRFTLYKFRSMIEDAEARQADVEHLNEMDGPVFKIRRDPRVTWLGRILRKFSLDEIPQLYNVLRGDMSLVGPRPPIPDEVARYQRWQRRRLSMKPGLTGLAQVSGRNDLDFDRWMKLDLEYIDTWTPWLDLKILARTVPAVLTGRGAS